MITTEHWAVLGQALMIMFALVGIFAIAHYVARGIDR